MKHIRSNWHKIVLLLILALTGFLSFYAIDKEGYANAYYSAAVKSMLTNWHNFFFASFDPSGFVTVDKPALGLWLQALSALIFGFHGWSLILPEALSAVVSVAILYHLVQRSFGKTAGLVSALVLALTPILIAVSRTNNLDASLVMVLPLAAWALMVAAERSSFKHLLLSMVLVGLGFNIKMLQAFMVLPAFYLVYLFTSSLKTARKLLQLTGATILLLAVSLSWAVIVDSTPANQRPYIGSSQTNSVIELALGYNGIQRITGATNNRMRTLNTEAPPNARNPLDGFNGRPGDVGSFNGPGGPGGSGGPGGDGENGTKGVFRIFNQQMAGQISWLIPMALFGILVLVLRGRKKAAGDRKNIIRNLLLWAAWIVPMFAYFSIAGYFHRYYLSMLAPGIAALAGIGIVEMWKSYLETGWKWVLLPAALIINAALQGYVLSSYEAWSRILVPVVCGASLASALVLIIIRLLNKDSLDTTIKVTVAAGFAALLISPAIWAYTPIMYGSQTTLPVAGPELDNGSRNGWNNPGNASANQSPENAASSSPLVKFLLNKKQNEKYLVAVPDVSSAESIILETGESVMAVGGFLGSDNILTVEKLEEMVKAGELRYFETGGRGMGPQSEITAWVQQHGTVVSSNEWSGLTTSTDNGYNLNGFERFGGRMGNRTALYDLAPEKG